MAFDLAKFRREFDEARNIAEDARNAVEVRAAPMVQANREILVGRCPKCNTQAALDREGRHLCRTCWTWLRYVRDERQRQGGGKRGR